MNQNEQTPQPSTSPAAPQSPSPSQIDTTPGTRPGPKGQSFGARLLDHFQAWVGLFTDLLFRPNEAMAKLPTSGSWERPLTYVVAGYGIIGLWQALRLRWGTIFVEYILSGVIFFFVGSFLIDLIVGAIKEKPGYYRTAFFMAVIVPVQLAGYILALIHPLLLLAAVAVSLYMLHNFLMQIGKLTKQQSLIFIGVVALLMLPPAIMRFFGTTIW
jgi:hypothetical protein